LIQLAIKLLFNFPLHPAFASALLGESRPSIIRVKLNEKTLYNRFYLFRSVGPNSRFITKFDYHAAVPITK